MAEAILPQPLQYVLLVVHVAAVDAREPLAEVHDGRQLGDSPFAGVPGVSHFDEGDVQVVGFAVNQLELLENGFTLGVVFFDCVRERGKETGEYDLAFASEPIVLTEKDGQKFVLVQKFVQHLPVDFLNLVLDFENILRCQPVHNALVIMHVSIVQHWVLFPA